MTTNKSQTNPWQILIALVAIGLMGWLVFNRVASPEVVTTEEVVLDTANWQTYQSAEFGFELKYPADWQVASLPNHMISPMVNVYKPGAQQPPLDHFSDATHVSVYPQGIPTEGVPGATKPTAASTTEPIERGVDFVLSDGTVYATFLNFSKSQKGWTAGGFLWGKVQVENESEECFRGDVKLAMEQCDYLTGDTVVRHGTINKRDKATVDAIIASFRLLP